MRGESRLAWFGCVVLLGSLLTGSAHGQTDAERIESLERQLAEIQAKLATIEAKQGHAEEATGQPAQPATTEPLAAEIAEIARRVEVLAGELERLQLGEVVAEATSSEHGMGPAASKVYRASPGLSIGGYGEMLYQDPSSNREDGSPSGQQAQLDFLRSVFYFGYKFNEQWLFNSEVEIEHTTTDDGLGEVSLEFAYLDYLWKPELSFRAGLLLVPMGFLNELHEPTVFLGTERPRVERVILPTTWRENGLGIFGESGPFTYRSYVLNGLDAAEFSAGGLRGGRQKGSRATAEDFAWVGRLDWSPTPGLVLGGSAYFGGSDQGLLGPDGRPIDVGTDIVEGHAEWRWRGLQARGLWTQAKLDDVARLNETLGFSGAGGVAERLSGGYLEAGWDVLANRGSSRQLIPFVRFESYDTHDQVPVGFQRDPARAVDSFTLGINFQPIAQVVFKADFRNESTDANRGVDQLNLSIGYIF